MEQVEVKEFVTRADGQRAYIWRTITATQARRKAEPRLRCPECKGPVGLYAASEAKQTPDRGEHRPKFDGCSLGNSFKGKPLPSPHAIEPHEAAEEV
jgi:hypothetical protein